jgi:DNA-directed RNA polymerase sigma subunit (sigma70/sigma32)
VARFNVKSGPVLADCVTGDREEAAELEMASEEVREILRMAKLPLLLENPLGRRTMRSSVTR